MPRASPSRGSTLRLARDARTGRNPNQRPHSVTPDLNPGWHFACESAAHCVAAGVIGLGMTARGGIVTLLSLTEKNSAGLQLWAISVPSMLAGLLLVAWCRRSTKWRSEPTDTPPTLPPA